MVDIWFKTSIPLVTNSIKSKDVIESIIKFILNKPSGTIKTITFDRDKEFNKWKKLENIYKIKVYFANVGCSIQKELNENNNEILRQSLPKGIYLSIFSQYYLNKMECINYSVGDILF
ncbi:hypothetical protein [Spiroplasma endosymbiont of Polydrusus formosus]|uniref:hypothetical protein n=1 Tax=Spiroplasma endosymbiont of Polydrusus formosus TaxID=3139326 RepID=UPI0035B554C0